MEHSTRLIQLGSHLFYNTHAHVFEYPITEVFRLVDTKFANSAELNSCSQNLRALHLYDSIFARLNLSRTCANSTGQPT